MPTLLEELRERRAAARTAADQILTCAADESRDLTGDELAEHAARTVEARELDDRLDELRDAEIAELRAASVRRPGPAVPTSPCRSRAPSTSTGTASLAISTSKLQRI